MFFSSFQTRLVVFFVGLLFVALSASFLAVNQAQVRNANRVITADLAEDAAVFRRLFSDRTERLLEAARLLSSDFAFKIAYSTGEHATIVSAMENHLARIVGADTMLLVSLDDDILADTSLPEGGVERRNPWPWIAAAALDDDYGEAASIVMLDDHLMQMMVVPFMVPDLDAWIFIGFLLNDDYALMFEELILSRVSILHETVDVPGTCRNVASTLDGSDRNRLATLRDAGELPADTTRTVRMNGDDFVSSVIPVSRSADDLVLVVLQRSLDEELAPYARLRSTLIVLFASSLLLSIVGAIAIARSVTRPVLELAAGARRIDEGDYAQRVEIDRKDEIGVLAASFNRMAKGLAEKERVRDLLGKVVSPAIAEELLSKDIALGGEERVVTVLFSDVRNFTALCEGRGPEEILSLLNLYLTQVSNLIEDNGGVVDKYIGDAVMALFGAPLEMGNDAANAVRTGMGMRRILVDLNRGFAEQGLPQIGIGIGINTGLVVAGNMGSERRLNYTVIGDGVNLAARLEGLTKKYGLEIIVSESTRRAAPGYVYRKLDRVRVKGKKDAVGIYEPLGESDALDAAERRDLEIFDGAMRDLRLRHWDPARSALSRLRDGDADGRYAKLYGVYLERLEHYVAEPPDSEWDGTVEFSEK